jgi:protein TonB
LAYVRNSNASAPRIGFGISLALHAFVAVASLGSSPLRNALPAATPMKVRLVAPPTVDAQPAALAIATANSKPRPVAKLMALAAPASMSSPVPADPVEAHTGVATSPAPTVPAPQTRAAAEQVHITAPVFDASYLENPAPAYPALSRRLGEQGKVILRVLVNADGTTDEVQLRASSGYGRLDEAARDSVRRWKFVPATSGAEPCPAWVLVPISFRLEG